MNPSSFDRMLVDSGKTTLENDAAVGASLLALTRRVQREGSRPRRRVPRLLPALAVVGLAVTAGAAAWMTSVEPDVVIPVAYTTDAGRSVECVIYFEVPDADLRAYLNDADWNGLGQRIYDQALAASLAPRDDLTLGSMQ